MSNRDPRRGSTEIVVFGRHPVFEALQSDGAEVHEVRVTRGASPADRKALRKASRQSGIDYSECSRDELTDWTHAPRHDQGIAAKVRLLRVTEVDSLIAGATGRAARSPIRLVGLDGVTNSQNVGMVVRSVVGAGLDGLLWPVVGQPWVNGLVVRAAAGSLFECPIVRCETLLEGLFSLQAAGFDIQGLDASASVSVFDCPPAHRATYVLGSESLGLSEPVRALLDTPVSIPMAGPLESLNVAVAAGMVCFHAAGLLGR
mgnify:FL=1